VTDPVAEVVTAEVEEAVVAEAVAVTAVTADPEMLLVTTSKLPPQPNEHL
jgi:hypothetical protein